MTAQALYLKYRPQNFAQVQGQEHISRTLQNQIKQSRIAHAYLFTGPRGTGKTSTARILAKAVNCLSADEEKPCNHCAICLAVNQERMLDLIEIDAASNTSVEDVRSLRDKIDFRPGEARYKVYIIDEAHMLSGAAFNALLKTLEEPPAHVIFVLATTEPNKIPATIASRCQRFDFRRAGLADLVRQLGQIASSEDLQLEPAALELIARLATGSFRDATSLLDQLTAYGSQQITLVQVQGLLGATSPQALGAIARAIGEKDVGRSLEAIGELIDRGADPRQLARDLVEFFRDLLLVQVGREAALILGADELEQLKGLSERTKTEELLFSIRLFTQAGAELRASTNPSLPLEMAAVEACLEPAAVYSLAAGGKPAPAPPRPPRFVPTIQPKPPSGDSKARPEPARAVEPTRLKEPEPHANMETSADPGTLDEVRKRWPEVLARLRSVNRNFEALLKDSVPVRIEELTVVLGLESEFHVRKLETDLKGKTQLEKSISAYFPELKRVRPSLSPKRQKMKAVETDPLVSTALNLGGEIVDVHEAAPKE